MTVHARRSAHTIVDRIDRQITRHHLCWTVPPDSDRWVRCAAIDAVMAELVTRHAPGLSLEEFGAEDPDQFDRLHTLVENALITQERSATTAETAARRPGRRRGRWPGGRPAA